MTQPSGLDELDRLAAEKVMGWVPTNVHDFYKEKEGDTKFVNRDYWNPTRNISQAFECIEEMADERWLVTLYAGAQDKSAVIYRYDHSFHEYGNTLPEAIVRACLKAKGIDT